MASRSCSDFAFTVDVLGAAGPRICNSRDCWRASSVLAIAERKYPTWSGLAWIAAARVMVSSSGLIAPVGADSAGGTVECGRCDSCPHPARDMLRIATAKSERMSGRQPIDQCYSRPRNWRMVIGGAPPDLRDLFRAGGGSYDQGVKFTGY